MSSSVRRRVRLPPSEPSDSTRDESPDKSAVDHVPKNKQPTRKRRNTFIFLLGSLFGIIAAGFFAKSNDLIDFPEIGELSMDSLFDVLPAGFVKDMREFVVCNDDGSPFRHESNRFVKMTSC
jgi:phospholipid:diacylglycerol acyltransferase